MISYLSKINNILIFFSFFSLFFLWSFELSETNRYYNFKYVIFYPIFISIFSIFFFSRCKFILQYIYYFAFFLIHYFLVNFINNTEISISEVSQIIFIIFLFISYFNYRNFIKNNFIYFLYFFHILLIISSLIIPSKINDGSCSYYLQIILSQAGLQFSQGIFQERSHLSMVNIGIIFASIFYFAKFKDYKLIILTFLSFLINLFNINTTFILGYLLCSLVFLIIVKDNFTRLFFLFSSFLLLIFFFNNKDCSKKVTDIKFEKVLKDELKSRKNLTSSVYERSLIISKKTFLEKPWGWGYDGSIKAADDLYKKKIEPYKDIARRELSLVVDFYTFKVNKKDLLGNIFKITTEFGILIFAVLLIFIYYILKNKNFHEYQIFLISIFVVQLFRGAGYINSGFLLAIFEFFIFYKTFKNKQIN